MVGAANVPTTVVLIPAEADAGMRRPIKIARRSARPDTPGNLSSRPRHRTVVPGAYVMLAVSDTGVGMDKDTQAHVFEPFFTTKGREQGTGLGLAIADSTIRRFNGAIELQSSPQHGSRFRILLPITPVG